MRRRPGAQNTRHGALYFKDHSRPIFLNSLSILRRRRRRRRWPCAVVGASDRSAGPVLRGTCSAETRLSSSTQNSAVVHPKKQPYPVLSTAKVLKSNPRLQQQLLCTHCTRACSAFRVSQDTLSSLVCLSFPYRFPVQVLLQILYHFRRVWYTS